MKVFSGVFAVLFAMMMATASGFLLDTSGGVVRICIIFIFCSGRRLMDEDVHQVADLSTEVETAIEVCGDVKYNIELVMMKETGHLLGYAYPTDTSNEECISLITHVVSQDGQQKKSIEWFNPKDFDQDEFDKAAVSYEFGTRTFSEIVSAVDAVEVDGDTVSYMHSMVPTNCGTFLLELGKLLQISIDTDVVSFVVSNMKGTQFLDGLSSNSAYKMLSGESWFGASSGSDSSSVVRRLFEYMLDQQYPQELVRV